MPEPDINYSKEAFLHPWNLTFLIVGLLSSFAVISITGAEWAFQTILLFAAAMELLYLGYMPRQERFRRAVRSRRAEEHAKPPSQKEIFQLLTRQSQRRYARLRKLEKDIASNYRKLSYASQGMLDSHLKKIDGLLDSYLNMLYQKERYEYSARTATEAEVVRAMESLRRDMEDDSPRVRAIKERRLRILEQRLGRSKRGAENLEIIEAQLETIEDVSLYIHEQSLTLRNPEEITFQLDTLLSEVEETQSSVEEIEQVFSSTTDLLGDLDTFEAPDADSSQRSPGAQLTPTMDFETLLVDVSDGIALVTINRPDKLNALNRTVMTDLDACFEQLASDHAVRGVILTGAGEKAFVAGADIKQFQTLSALDAHAFALAGQRVLNRIENLEKPVVAAVGGFALGGGCELAMACHMRVAAPRAKFGQPEVGLGLIPGFGGSQRLPRLVGKGIATELILAGSPISAQRAYDIGLVNRLSEDDGLLEAARDLLGTILKQGPVAVALSLKALRASDLPLAEGLRHEAALFGQAFATEDVREGVGAFLERRKPDFKGR